MNCLDEISEIEAEKNLATRLFSIEIFDPLEMFANLCGTDDREIFSHHHRLQPHSHLVFRSYSDGFVLHKDRHILRIFKPFSRHSLFPTHTHKLTIELNQH